jgi:coenzyme F420 hydrogenase subunit beta
MSPQSGKFIPEIGEQCVNCGKCLSYCPSNKLEIENIRNFNLEDIIFGKHINIYTANMSDDKIRSKGTSGGLITGLIIRLLEDKKYQGAFVLPFDSNTKNKQAKLKLATSKEKVLKASKSKYCPVSIENIIKEIDANNKSKYIIVGTPCQFYSIQKYIKDKSYLNIDNYLFLGLFCDCTMNFNFIKYMEDNFGKKGEKILKLEYRSKEKRGWPGDVKIVFDNGRKALIDRNERGKVKKYFKLKRCRYCFDKLNIGADISFGDCYIKGEEDPKGKSSIIVRTEKGQKIINGHLEEIKLKKSTKKEIKASQFLHLTEERLKLGFNYFNIYKKNYNILGDIKVSKNNANDKYHIMTNNIYDLIGNKYKALRIFYIESIVLEFFLKVNSKIKKILKSMWRGINE